MKWKPVYDPKVYTAEEEEPSVERYFLTCRILHKSVVRSVLTITIL